MSVALYPLPIGAVTLVVDHHAKTVRWVRKTADGEVDCEPPAGWRLPLGFVLSVDLCDSSQAQ
jgi:hypothetical protein